MNGLSGLVESRRNVLQADAVPGTTEYITGKCLNNNNNNKFPDSLLTLLLWLFCYFGFMLALTQFAD